MADETSYEEQVRTWSNIDLLDVAKHIDKDAFPERHRIVQAEIERRRGLPAPDVVPPPPRPPISRYATFWRRVGANLLDGLILVPIASGALHIAQTSTDTVSQAAPALAGTVLFHLYSIVFHGRNGQTVGKMAARVRLLDLSGEKLTVAQAFTRDLVPLAFAVALFIVLVNVDLPTSLPDGDYAHLLPGIALLSIGLLWILAEIITMVTNRRRRAVHDLIAGSVVVRVSGLAAGAAGADERNAACSRDRRRY